MADHDQEGQGPADGSPVTYSWPFAPPPEPAVVPPPPVEDVPASVEEVPPLVEDAPVSTIPPGYLTPAADGPAPDPLPEVPADLEPPVPPAVAPPASTWPLEPELRGPNWTPLPAKPWPSDPTPAADPTPTTDPIQTADPSAVDTAVDTPAAPDTPLIPSEPGGPEPSVPPTPVVTDMADVSAEVPADMPNESPDAQATPDSPSGDTPPVVAVDQESESPSPTPPPDQETPSAPEQETPSTPTPEGTPEQDNLSTPEPEQAAPSAPEQETLDSTPTEQETPDGPPPEQGTPDGTTTEQPIPDNATTMELLTSILLAPEPPTSLDAPPSPDISADSSLLTHLSSGDATEIIPTAEPTLAISPPFPEDLPTVVAEIPAYPAEPRQPSTEEPTKRPVGLIVLLIIAIIIAGAGLAAYLLPRMQTDADEPGIAYSPSEAVEEYLEALASGDADTALLYSATESASTTFLSSAFLLDSLRANPLTDIDVPPNQASESPATIRATYTLGEESISAAFTVRQHGRTWLLDGGFIQLNLFNLLTKGIPLTLNGAELGTDQKIDLFPGVYTLASANPMITMENSTFTIEYPEGHNTIDQMSFALSEEGATAIREAAKAKLDSCLASVELRPEGCGFGFAGATNGTVDPATLTWTLLPESVDLATTELALEANSVTMAAGTIDIRVAIHAISTDQRYIYDDTTSVTKMKADFADQDNIIVTFGS